MRAAGLSEREAKLQIACRWFDEGVLSFGHAARLAGLGDVEFEAELKARAVPRYRYTEQMLEDDVDALKKTGRW